MGPDFGVLGGRECDALEELIDARRERVRGATLDKAHEARVGLRIPLLTRPMLPQPIHQRLPAEALDHDLEWREIRGVEPPSLSLVELEAVAVWSERVDPPDIAEDLGFVRRGAVREGKAQRDVVEQVHERGLACAGQLQVHKPPEHGRQDFRVVERVVCPALRDTEPLRQGAQ